MFINAIVVIYKSRILQSDTIKAIFQADLSHINLTITIWNNGPEFLEQDDINNYMEKCRQYGISSSIYQDIRNISLSKIYNHFFSEKTHDFFVVLDQDTSIAPDFFSNIYTNKDYELICPEVYLENDNNQLDGPIYYPSKKQVPPGDFNANSILTCGSGLSISSSLCQKAIKEFGFIFDERFAFYLADQSFLMNLKYFDFIKGKCIGKILHNLSGHGEFRLMKESSKLEHGYALVLRRIIWKNKSSIIKNYFHAIKFIFESRCSYSSTIKILKCTFAGRHPRSEFKIDKNIKPTNYC
ncbi:glycosyl transferase [Brenneria corticis]|uniref:Glycosyl transferase n=1 Tax=Brenneria corticis TaxID=2173106 RepID=A0A2U1UDQ4_9GAMM|nr:glycosyl transferase [Brenneria sp. CFCC 11842]PWC19704.1 glycosyl transferase [Brenneria sp. CFCC 11842]